MPQSPNEGGVITGNDGVGGMILCGRFRCKTLVVSSFKSPTILSAATHNVEWSCLRGDYLINSISDGRLQAPFCIVSNKN